MHIRKKWPFKNTYDIILLCPFSLNFDQAIQLSIAFVGCPKLGFCGESCSMLCSKNCFCHITDLSELSPWILRTELCPVVSSELFLSQD